MNKTFYVCDHCGNEFRGPLFGKHITIGFDNHTRLIFLCNECIPKFNHFMRENLIKIDKGGDKNECEINISTG